MSKNRIGEAYPIGTSDRDAGGLRLGAEITEITTQNLCPTKIGRTVGGIWSKTPWSGGLCPLPFYSIVHNFCERGGRFGAHSSNESTAPIFHKKIAFFTWFNAGVRSVDIRDPYSPKEIGYFIPAITQATDKRCVKIEGKDRCKIAIQSNNLETDDRGYIYVVDRANTGLHILELTGEARQIAGQQ